MEWIGCLEFMLLYFQMLHSFDFAKEVKHFTFFHPPSALPAAPIPTGCCCTNIKTAMLAGHSDATLPAG